MEESQLINQYIADAIIERPHGFSVGSRHFYLYPVTLGKMYLLQRLMETLELDNKLLQQNPFMEANRLVSEKKDVCCQVLAYHTMRTKDEIFDNRLVQKTKKFFMRNMEDKDIATLLIMAMTSDKTMQFVKYLKLDKEDDRMRQVMSVKKDKNSYSFGGKSVYGMLIDSACERYGWTMDYVVWGISFTNLQMLLKDSVKIIYLSDEERKKCHVSNSKEERIDANDPDFVRKVREQFDFN